jgi:hypothetical protein
VHVVAFWYPVKPSTWTQSVGSAAGAHSTAAADPDNGLGLEWMIPPFEQFEIRTFSAVLAAVIKRLY